jgi:hypothetical protein
MSTLSVSDLKKALVAHGFEVYRTIGDLVVIAERVRDNLIMDSNVAAGAGSSLSVRFVVRAQGNDFPSEGESQLFGRARQLAKACDGRGYREVDTTVVPIRDPGDATRTLDTWYEVAFVKNVVSLDDLLGELNYALSFEKTAIRS